MDVTLDQCQKLVADVQVAHRLLVAYYERLTSRMDMVARDLDARFFRWEPTETERPCRAKTLPSRNWLWDMVPLYAAYHAYGKTSANTIRVEDFAIDNIGDFMAASRKDAREAVEDCLER